LSELTHILVDRLEKKEMEPGIIPCFIRDLATTVLINPDGLPHTPARYSLF